MSPGHQLQRLLAEIPGYEAADLVSLLPLAAALQSALYARILALHHQATLPDTELPIEYRSDRYPARQIHQVDTRQRSVAALRLPGRQRTPFFRPRPRTVDCRTPSG